MVDVCLLLHMEEEGFVLISMHIQLPYDVL